ncbi:MAG: hypothetical protein FD155_2614 [Bacteroidetes bacterium]|nr:MAG: hypothetical protein FD155_2614 [Bacteroidota bacterium]
MDENSYSDMSWQIISSKNKVNYLTSMISLSTEYEISFLRQHSAHCTHFMQSYLPKTVHCYLPITQGQF